MLTRAIVRASDRPSRRQWDDAYGDGRAFAAHYVAAEKLSDLTDSRGRHRDRDEDEHLPLEPADEVYRIYGNVMHLVQTWELALALLSWRVKLPQPSGEAESDASAVAVGELERAFQRVTAGRARRDLEDNLPAEVAGTLDALIPNRNRLAHRFLREQQLRDGFQPGSLVWLGNAGAGFEASLKQINLQLDAFGSYDGPVRSHWPRLAQLLAGRLFAGERAGMNDALRQSRY